MSIKAPKPKQIRLPFSVPKPGISGSSAPTRVCGICKKKDSLYTCPRCNVTYCSLDCFRAPSHTQCSEPFYRSSILDEIGESQAGPEEKKAMLEMLKRFEESQIEGENPDFVLEQDDGDEDEDEEYDQLVKALEGVDLDTINTNELLRLLPPSQRDVFLNAIRNPESEICKELLEAATKDSSLHSPSTSTSSLSNDNDEQQVPDVLPWWESNFEESEEGYEERPPLIDSKELKLPEGTGKRMVYNALAIAMGYVHVLLYFRLPSLAPTYLEKSSQKTKQLTSTEGEIQLKRIIPFLTEKSTIRHTSRREAWSSTWESIGLDTQGLDPSILIRLLTILKTMIHPPLDTSARPGIMYVLSDLHRLYSGRKDVEKKIEFYLVALNQIGRKEWLDLEKHLEKDIIELERELGDEEEIRDTRLLI
ncbi:hypothetical protein TREMEDRAFT_34242 [Tremella mesenterica DSM 1558]|uniref:uncharacterized protein n=1 Tax=Tremella mesenterica (strain ATCC 24925 / CBS 8224 / DSM 1558 / NBRC 9311 / NRRL Y-6157 / RJB 2259-6 / UBC 559-6) TaxID=578456 RepID=UPI0003F495F8|nr:uncharacterized protein TREMEDRAFT_34242 [Tremella mesenterica DSM 1558]EIW67068.1 hypothetical protein TREMEDRAFT_34242 [Tremella mesenterica DSM 1558]